MESSCRYDRSFPFLIYILKNDLGGSLRFFTVSSQLYVESFKVKILDLTKNEKQHILYINRESIKIEEDFYEDKTFRVIRM